MFTVLALAIIATALAGSVYSFIARARVPLPDTSELPALRLEPTDRRRDDIGFSLGAAPLGWPDAELAHHLDIVAASGAGWIRIDVDWSDVEEERGRHDWSTVDRVVQMASVRELRVLGLLTYTPVWARPANTTDKHPPVDPTDMAAFAASAAGRYGPGGSGDVAGSIRHWEIWNEPNLEGFWESGADPTAYAALYTEVAGALRRADPGATIIAGGLGPADDGGGDLSPGSFTAAFVAAGAPEELIDAIAIHPYTYPALPGEDQGWNTWHRMEAVVETVEASFGRSVPVWATEFGAPTGGKGSVGLDRQAEIMAAAMECSVEQLAGPLFLYSVVDLDSTDEDREGHFGLITSDERAKPAWQVLTSFTAGSPRSARGCG